MKTKANNPALYYPALGVLRLVDAVFLLNTFLGVIGSLLCVAGLVGGLAYGYFNGAEVQAAGVAKSNGLIHAWLQGLSTTHWWRSTADWLNHPGWSGFVLLLVLPGLLPVVASLAIFSGAASLGAGDFVRGVLVVGGVGLIGLIALGVLNRLNGLVERMVRMLVKPIEWVALKSGPAAGGDVRDRALAARPAANLAAQGASAIRFPCETPRLSFKDLQGMSVLKTRLKEAGEAAKASGDEHRNGVLLYGKPGNGKTTMAKALAGELGVGFLSVSIADIQSRWVGQTTEQLVQVFRDACAQAPCVLLIDEVESVIASRERPSGNDEDGKTTNAFLTEVVRARNQGVLVMAATNFLDRLDQAAIREGRFDYKIEVPPPDLEARIGLLHDGIAAVSPSTILAPSVLLAAAKRWEGFSVARIRSIASLAGKQAAQGVQVTREGLMEALKSLQVTRTTLTEGAKSIADLSLDPEQRAILQSIAWRMKQCFDAEDMGASAPDGLLFFGPPGTGKTEGVRALAKHTGWALFSTSGTELIGDPSKIDEILTQAEDARPAIIFIDEGEEVLQDRRYGRASTVTNKLLSAMDGVAGKVSDILFIAATNHPNGLDPAVLRGGRFTEKVGFTPPAQPAMVQMITAWLTSKAWEIDGGPEEAATMLTGLAPADIKAVLQAAVNQVATAAAMSGGEVTRRLSADDLLRARERVAPSDLQP